jgi:magnesium transporter
VVEALAQVPPAQASPYREAKALLATLMLANLGGALIPLVLKRANLDPALTAGPLMATIIDAIGITVYFQLAILIMRGFA